MHRKRIAVLMASIDREYQQNFAFGLTAAGSEYGIDICIFNSQGHTNVETDTSEIGESIIYDLPDLNGFDGIISLPATTASDVMQKKMYDVLAQVKGKPHISIDVPQDGAVTITFNDQDSMEQLTEHLITEHDVKKIAFVSGPLDAPVATGRIEACKHALKRHGLYLDDRLIFDGQWTRIGGRASTEKLLSLKEDLPDAIICGNDDMALSVLECLKEHNIRVPSDIIVTGFDAIQEAKMRGLTTIHRPIDMSARKAIEILNTWIDGNEPQEKTVILPTNPVFGSSCGCNQDLAKTVEALRSLVSEKWNTEASFFRISILSGAMAGVSNEAEAREKIHTLTEALDIRDFYLCADPAICRDIETPDTNASFPKEMLLISGMRNGNPCEADLFPGDSDAAGPLARSFRATSPEF